MSYGVGQRCGLDLVAVAVTATAPTGHLAWEPPYAVGVALKKKKKTKNSLSVAYFLKFYVNILLLIIFANFYDLA